MKEHKIYRSLDDCFDCPNFKNVELVFGEQNDEEEGRMWFCKQDARIEDNGRIRSVHRDFIAFPKDWNKMLVNRNCERYAEYFLKDCNEKKP